MAKIEIDKNILFAAIEYAVKRGAASSPKSIFDTGGDLTGPGLETGLVGMLNDLQELRLKVTIEEALADARALALKETGKETGNEGEDKPPDERDARLEEMKHLYDALQNYILTLLASGVQYGLGLARLERDLRRRSDSAEVS